MIKFYKKYSKIALSMYILTHSYDQYYYDLNEE